MIYRSLPCGGYTVLTPTKGWRKFTARRLWAIARTANLKNGINR